MTKKYFFCYNKQLSDYFKANGIEFITVAIDPNTRRWYSLYEINPEMQLILDEYKKISSSKISL
jgi:hypothetical protein